ncbi:MAG: HNH endonuclease signature motif containing protein [Opitutaceae bacterium]
MRSATAAWRRWHLVRFNATGSFLTTDYRDEFRNASYVLGILRQITSPKRAFRSEASHAAERETRGMLKPFFEARGFTQVEDVRKEMGSAIAQKLIATIAGERRVMSVRMCWHKKSNGDAIVHSAAQLLARVDKRDWIGPLQAKIDREREAGVTHLLLVQRAGATIVHAASIPLAAVVPIWITQRDTSQRLIDGGGLGLRRKNHAMNGSSPTIWLRDVDAEEVTRALWDFSGVEDVAARAIVASAADDTFDDLPTVDYASLGRDGASRIERVVSGVPRSPLVRAEVIRRSGGTCELPGCGERRNYPGFLDVHHILGVETSDRIWNCVALCPNCHRATHFAPNRREMNDELLLFASVHETV